MEPGCCIHTSVDKSVAWWLEERILRSMHRLETNRFDLGRGETDCGTSRSICRSIYDKRVDEWSGCRTSNDGRLNALRGEEVLRGSRVTKGCI